MATTMINMAGDLTNNLYTGVGVAATNNYAVINVDWANLNGQPELLVETALENEVDTIWYPAKVVEQYGIETPIKLRMIDTDGNENITVDSVYGATPFVRVKVFGSNCTSGILGITIDVG